MADVQSLMVTVVLAEAAAQRIVTLTVPAGATAWQVVLLSRLLGDREDLELSRLGVAVYGRMVDRNRAVEHGDRVEILRPLLQDPKVRRRRLARDGAATGRAARKP